MTSFGEPFLCRYCERFAGTMLIGTDTFTCDAYPDGIPDDIMTNRVDHRVPHDGDGGLTFVALPNRSDYIDAIAWQTD